MGRPFSGFDRQTTERATLQVVHQFRIAKAIAFIFGSSCRTVPAEEI